MIITRSRRSFLRHICAAGCVAAGLPLAGCDDDEDEKKKARAKLPKLSLQSPWVNDAEFIGYFVAIEKGYYDDEKINFEYFEGSPDIVAGAMLVGNRCDVALTNLDGTAKSIIGDNAPLKVIGAQYQKSPLGIVTLKENGIRAPKDLVGKTIAVPDANIPTTLRPEEVRIGSLPIRSWPADQRRRQRDSRFRDERPVFDPLAGEGAFVFSVL
jgi:ABC-type nitrate/sulfonate/bicarbonate transport system substrate-binding protein